jgi:hypothetical protein
MKGGEAMSESNDEALLGVNYPQEQRPSSQPLEKHGVVVDAIVTTVGGAVGTAAGPAIQSGVSNVVKKLKDK